MTTDQVFYKAIRPDGTSFYDSNTRWKVGRIVKHPRPNLSTGLCSNGVLHASDAPGETLLGGSWPCRLLRVTPRGQLINENHKFGCAAWKVEEELPAWQALGPNGEAVAELIGRAKTITAEQATQLYAARAAAWAAAWDAARDAAWAAARDAAWAAAGDAAWDAARDAARAAARAAARDAAWAAARAAAWAAARDVAGAAGALVTRDLITAEQFNLLYGPWDKVMNA